MTARAEVNGRTMHYDDVNSVWVWDDTGERVATPYEKSVGIVMDAVARWKTHNEGIVGTDKPLVLETVIKEAMEQVFVLVRDVFYGPSVTPTVPATVVVDAVNEAGGEQETGEVPGKRPSDGEGQ